MIDYDDSKEVQFAEVSIRVALPVSKDDDEETRAKAILRKIRLSDRPDELELRPGLNVHDVTMNRTETMEEAARRHEGEAEAAAEAKLDRQRERYFDNNGHY
jgi:hypothetical protein